MMEMMYNIQVEYAGVLWNIIVGTERRKVASLFLQNIYLFHKLTMMGIMCNYSMQYFWSILEHYIRDRNEEDCIIIPTENIIISHVENNGDYVQLFNAILLEYFETLY